MSIGFYISFCRGQHRTGMTSQWGVTPRFGGAQTPMVGSMTPMHGVGSGRTPLYGSQTPQHGDGESEVAVNNNVHYHPTYIHMLCVHAHIN